MKVSLQVVAAALALVLLCVADGALAREGIGSSATTNYASAYLGAKIVDYHPEAKGVHNVLNEDRDKYMIIPCKAQRKQLTVQLSREVELSIVAVTNLEYFSSAVRNFTLLGSKHYPCLPPGCMWRVMGSFTAGFVRTPQRFIIPKLPPIRFLRFQWVTHHGQEKSCTMTSLQAYGTDMLETLAAELNSQANDEFEQHGGGDDDAAANVAGRTETQYVHDVAGEVQLVNESEIATNSSGPAVDALGGVHGDGASPPKQKWRTVALVFPSRNSTSSPLLQCVASDREAEVFYEVGPGARCYKRGRAPTKEKGASHLASNLLAFPHISRQLRSLQQDIARLQRQAGLSEATSENLVRMHARLAADVASDQRQTSGVLDSLKKEIMSLSHELRQLSLQWELRFSDSKDAWDLLPQSVVWWLLAFNVVFAVAAVFIAYHRPVPVASLRAAAVVLPPHIAAAVVLDDDPERSLKTMFPLSSSSANFDIALGVDEPELSIGGESR